MFEPTPAPDGARFVHSALITANRDRMAVCVAGVGKAKEAEAEAKLAIETALREIAKIDLWERTAIPREPPPLVDVGCPYPPLFYTTRPGALPGGCHARGVTSAHYYRLFVYVVPQEELKRVLSNKQWICGRITNEEIIQMYDTAHSVTSGIYLADEELCDSRFVIENIEWALGLIVQFPDPPHYTASACPG